MFSFVLAWRVSAFRYKCRNSRLQINRGAPNIRCMHSSCDFTSLIDCMLNHRNTADPVPCLFSRAFSMHSAKLCSITLISAPWPDFVMYLVMYSMTASFESVAWKSMLDSVASETSGTKLFRKWQFRAIHSLYKSRRRGSSATSSQPGCINFRGNILLHDTRSLVECSSSTCAHRWSLLGGPMGYGLCRSCIFVHSASTATK